MKIPWRREIERLLHCSPPPRPTGRDKPRRCFVLPVLEQKTEIQAERSRERWTQDRKHTHTRLSFCCRRRERGLVFSLCCCVTKKQARRLLSLSFSSLSFSFLFQGHVFFCSFGLVAQEELSLSLSRRTGKGRGSVTGNHKTDIEKTLSLSLSQRAVAATAAAAVLLRRLPPRLF